MPVNAKRSAQRESGNSFIPENFDDGRSYRTQLTKIEEKPSLKKAGTTYFSWHLTPYDEDGVAFLDGSGAPLDVWATSPIELWNNEKDGKKSIAWEYAEAFMGRELSDEDIDDLIADGFAEPLEGKWAMGLFEPKTATDSYGNTYERLNVVRLRPMRKKTAAMPQQDAIPPRRPRTVPPEDDEQ